MPHENLAQYQDGFLEVFLAELPQTPTVETLKQAQPEGAALTLAGDYQAYEGSALTPLPSASITPQYCVRTGSGESARTYVLVWAVERFDIATDSQQTIKRILADFRSPTTSGGSEAGGLATSLADSWAEALVSDEVRTALAKNLDEVSAVPAGLPTENLEDLKSFLLHFGTYKADGSYYQKGSVAEGAFPAGVSPAYFATDTGNLAEVRLQRDHFYCYALVSERLWNPQARGTAARQLVYRIDDLGEEASPRWSLALLHTAKANQSTPANRFLFFHAPVGLGLAVGETARTTLGPSTAAFLEQLPGYTASLADALADPDTPLVGTEASPYVLLIGAVAEGFPTSALPEGVIADGEGAVRTFRCPPPQVMALAERSDIQELTLSTPVWVDMQNAQAELNLAGRTFPPGITAANSGKGVVIGIVDSGIDGGHPAFLGREDDATKSRIHSVWEMSTSGGQSPFQRSGQNSAYQAMNFGREYIGHDEVITATDFVGNSPSNYGPGHGTHVAGIAAGRAVGTWPGGISPQATLVVAGVGSVAGEPIIDPEP